MNKIKQNKKIITHTLIITAIILLAAVSLQAGFATTHYINSTNPIGINGTLAGATAGDTIELDEGTYTGNNNTNITINRNITIQGKTKDKVIIDAQGLSRVFAINNNLNVTFINITFINGLSVGNGGAIYNNYLTTTMTIKNCTFINNQVINDSITGHGGAIFDNGINTTITDCNFTDNSASARGGAVYLNGVNATVNNSNFTNNTASGTTGGGGGIHSSVRNLTIIGCNFIDNKANNDSSGGGFYSSGTAINQTFINCSFINNYADTHAGALYLTNNGLIIIDSNFTNNHINMSRLNSTYNDGSFSLNGGGAISASTTNLPIVINNCNFTNNSAPYGGAIYNRGNNTFIINNTFINNTASQMGGAIYNNRSNNVLNSFMACAFLSGNIMSGNTAGLGQMIYNADQMGVLNLTFINNSTYVVINGSIATIYATLTDDMGNTVTGQNITFYINGILGGVLVKNIESIEGNVSFNITVVGDEGDLFPVNGFYDGIGNYSININEGLLRLTGFSPFVTIATNSTISADDTTVGKQTVVKGVAKDIGGNVLANTQITVIVDGKTYTVTTNGAGEWTLTYMPTKSGKITATVSWAGNSTHTGFTNSATFNVAKIPTTKTIDVAKNVKIAENTVLKSKLTDKDGNPIANAVVDFYVNGKKVGSAKTDKNGIATLNYKYSNAGTYSVTSKYAGDETYLASTANGQTVVSKTQTKITIKVKRNKVTATLTDDKGNPLVGKKIVFRVKGVVVGFGITDSNGQVTIYYKNAEKYSITASFAGDANNKPSSATSTPNTSETNSASGQVAMKKTGLPIIPAILALLASIGIIGYRKRKV